MRRLGAALCTVLLVGAAAAIVAWEQWQGPVLLSLSAGHGIHVGDLAAAPLVIAAIALWRPHALADTHVALVSGRTGPASAVVLGVLLMLAAVVGTAGGGPLVPSAGGTFDGTIQCASDTSAVPVGRWSDVAVTYDGATLRLYVNGDQVASRAQTGTLPASRDPLWIGGNQPYGEHFHGLIDEVRVYARALRADEIRNDMEKAVAPARDLVAGYRFDAPSGTTAADSSGKGNTGAIVGATSTVGRYGDALRFDGTDAVVSVPPSASLNLTTAMTLSAWILPAAPQSGWRTIVQRQTDAYFLTASSDTEVRVGWGDDLRAAFIVAAFAWFCVIVATGRVPAAAGRRLSWWAPAALFVVGSVADAALAPHASLIGPSLVAVWLAATASGRAEAGAFGLVAVASAGLTLASQPGLIGADVAIFGDDGAVARSAALGVIFVMAGAARLVASRSR